MGNHCHFYLPIFLASVSHVICMFVHGLCEELSMKDVLLIQSLLIDLAYACMAVASNANLL